MKVAIQNPFAGQFVAETELSRRIALAASHIGWQAAEVHTANEIRSFHPDFVIALHNNSPKLTEHPTYGCMWNPPSFFEGTEPFVQHVLTYDGYLTSSIVLERWLHQLLYATPKRYFTVPFYTSCPHTSFQPPNLENPRLMYLGSNWDGTRFQALFEGLDRQEFMEVYGNPAGWTHLQSAYKGALPFDGASVLKALNQAGVGLCLHRSEHRDAALPSMRIFEVVASGAVAICSEHPFIRSAFGDAVLYFDPDLSIPEQLQQIADQMQWICAHCQTAIEMAAAAHEIFAAHYTLETLLEGILPHHQSLVVDKGFVCEAIEPAVLLDSSVICPPSPPTLGGTEPQSPPALGDLGGNAESPPIVEVILRVHQPGALPPMLAHLNQQTYANLSGTIVKPKTLDLTDVLPAENFLPLKILDAPPDALPSTVLWQGLNAIEADYFALLDETSVIYPNHVQTLVSLLEQHPEAGVAYAGSISAQSPPTETETPSSPIVLFQPFHLDRFLHFQQTILPHSFVARRSVLDEILWQDPQLQEHETLCLLFHLAQRSPFVFSYELTCESPMAPIGSNTLIQEFHDWSSELSRFKFIFWHQEFAPGKSLQSVHDRSLSGAPDWEMRSKLEKQQTELKRLRQNYQTNQAELQQTRDRLQTAQSRIEAMQTSKFWQLRSAWFRVKRAIGLPRDEGE
jgi:hypothetical protein